LVVGTRPNVDFEVTASDLSLVDGAAFLDQDAVFRVTVRNRGTLEATAAVRYEVTDG
ncbi:MAG: hypothetical protein GWO04_39705, partial [Actinobacteria bacterium]|nr:hypothetical protein [Actinomycetota bacterium]NIS35692.1 hypothetical protein [Actinomycetota bacterium]